VTLQRKLAAEGDSSIKKDERERKVLLEERGGMGMGTIILY